MSLRGASGSGVIKVGDNKGSGILTEMSLTGPVHVSVPLFQIGARLVTTKRLSKGGQHQLDVMKFVSAVRGPRSTRQ